VPEGGTARTPRFRRVTAKARRAELIEAGLRCLARSGIAGFTVDAISAEAGISRGLIAHHFGSKDGLLAAVYASAYDRMLAVVLRPEEPQADLRTLINRIFSPEYFNSTALGVWLALWGEVAINPVLRDEHRKLYALYRQSMARAIGTEARTRGREVDSHALATTVISLLDGLWLEQAIDPNALPPGYARDLCWKVIEAGLTAPGDATRPAR
jgi:AcrR family transcriptional regulator